jgi:hypothetical protein
MMLTIHPLLMPRLRKSWSYISSPSKHHPWHVTGALYFYCNYVIFSLFTDFTLTPTLLTPLTIIMGAKGAQIIKERLLCK